MNTNMMKQLLIMGALAIGMGAVALSCTNTTGNTAEKTAQETQAQLIKRGEYLVTIGGCNDCHTPKVMTDHGPDLDPARLLSGHISEEPVPPFDATAFTKGIVQGNMSLTAWHGPWGTSFSANLTPDKETGIGHWTLEQFKRALREGKSKGLPAARPILPPMPWFNFGSTDLVPFKILLHFTFSIFRFCG
jgi:hypothetical protein